MAFFVGFPAVYYLISTTFPLIHLKVTLITQIGFASVASHVGV